MKRARFVIRGRVQGVYFRSATVREATVRQVTGRVWNRDDGAVELVAEGEDASLESLAGWLTHGPRHASVESVERDDLPRADRRYADFAISDGSVG